jgi:outer membrane protein assembly factor BamD
MESFQRLVQAFPQSEYSQRAKKQLLECTKRLAYHEYHIAKFYFGRDRFEAAKVRLDKLTSTYPDATRELGLQKDVEKMQASCDRRIAAGGNKPSIWTRMGF